MVYFSPVKAKLVSCCCSAKESSHVLHGQEDVQQNKLESVPQLEVSPYALSIFLLLQVLKQ